LQYLGWGHAWITRGKAEVTDLELTPVIDQNVGRFQVEMHDAVCMDMMHAVRQFADNLPNPALVEALYDPAIFFQKKGECAEAQFGLYEELPILLPGGLEPEDMHVGRLR
jgi:hypothetical protein